MVTPQRSGAEGDGEGRAAHARPAEAVCEELGVRREAGLSRREAGRRLREHGPNSLREPEQRGVLRIALDQFKSTVILVLLVAGGLALAAGERPEAMAIAAVLAVNAAIGFVSEWRARTSMQALRALGRREARVRRGGRERTVPFEALVPGDVLLLRAGDLAPADARVLLARELRVSEAALTGESVPVTKDPEPVAAEAPLAERTSLVFKGTTVVDGEGEAVVVATGDATELGRIATLAEQAEAAETPLEQRLDRLGRVLAVVTLGLAAAIAGVGLASGQPVRLMLETAVALGVAAIPEGLPIVATLALARGMWVMARRNALINRLAAVETLGATRVIFTDKTGTLTRNQMTVRRIVTSAGDHGPDPADGEPEGVLRLVLETAVLCNDAALADEDGENEVGDPTELALLEAGTEAGLERPALLERWPEVREVPFDSDARMMATFHRAADGADGIRVAVKGAPAAVLEACTRVADARGDGEAPLEDRQRTEWLERAHALAGDGLRVLAVADRRVDDAETDPYAELRLLGLVGLLDPPREGVREAIAACRSAGIRVVVVTGDHRETAAAVAREVGIGEGGELRVMEGRELGDGDAELPAALRERVLRTDVFARLGPAQKLGLVRTFQEQGEIVAMTGDGVNDAPALKKADIGIAMGRRGTDAARQVSDMVLRDDAFSSIEAAVEQGRVIFANIRKSVLFMLCTNGAEILAIAAASVAAVPLPLRPLQILYLNVLTDVFPALALGVGPGSPAVMRRPPRDPAEAVLTPSHWRAIGGWALVIGGVVLGALAAGLWGLGLEPLAAVTVSFLTLGFAKLWFVFALRDPGSGLLDNDVVRNRWIWASIGLCSALLGIAPYAPGLSALLETRPPGASGWGVVLVLSLVPALVGQALRLVQGRR